MAPMALDYLIVGPYAVISYAQPRFANDIDFFIKADPANAQATYAGLAEFGAGLQGIRPEDFADRSAALWRGKLAGDLMVTNRSFAPNRW